MRLLSRAWPDIQIIPTNIARLKLSGKFPMGLGTPPLRFKIMLESNPLKSTMLVGRLGVWGFDYNFTNYSFI